MEHNCRHGINKTMIRLIFLAVCVVCGNADILVFSDMSKHQIEEEFRDVPARFGALIPSQGIEVMIVIKKNLHNVF